MTLSGRVMLVRLEQSKKQFSGRLVTPGSMVTSDRAVHCRYRPSLFWDSLVTSAFTSLVQRKNARSPTASMASPKWTSVMPVLLKA